MGLANNLPKITGIEGQQDSDKEIHINDIILLQEYAERKNIKLDDMDEEKKKALIKEIKESKVKSDETKKQNCKVFVNNTKFPITLGGLIFEPYTQVTVQNKKTQEILSKMTNVFSEK